MLNHRSPDLGSPGESQHLSELVLNVDRHAQDRAQRAYFGLPTPTDFATFRSLGLKLFTPQDLVCLMGSHLQRAEQLAFCAT
jgi:hypothetical protein